ncbi:hypothetical protein NDU88_004384 [Pleurodeles waltl]|uniref:Uncharacterized protein n=1 Tax=Pleurodeles waltl TaxID=8319 RepID=A0AAV7W7Z4_PLEWA|nr:hypothetical protein NDU88_004384 [Pleurodeles waltl]
MFNQRDPRKVWDSWRLSTLKPGKSRHMFSRGIFVSAICWSEIGPDRPRQSSGCRVLAPYSRGGHGRLSAFVQCNELLFPAIVNAAYHRTCRQPEVIEITKVEWVSKAGFAHKRLLAAVGVCQPPQEPKNSAPPSPRGLSVLENISIHLSVSIFEVFCKQSQQT